MWLMMCQTAMVVNVHYYRRRWLRHSLTVTRLRHVLAAGTCRRHRLTSSSHCPPVRRTVVRLTLAARYHLPCPRLTVDALRSRRPGRRLAPTSVSPEGLRPDQRSNQRSTVHQLTVSKTRRLQYTPDIPILSHIYRRMDSPCVIFQAT